MVRSLLQIFVLKRSCSNSLWEVYIDVCVGWWCRGRVVLVLSHLPPPPGNNQQKKSPLNIRSQRNPPYKVAVITASSLTGASILRAASLHVVLYKGLNSHFLLTRTSCSLDVPIVSFLARATVTDRNTLRLFTVSRGIFVKCGKSIVEVCL